MAMKLPRDNITMTRTVKKDRLVGMEVTLTSWRVFFRLFKLLFLQHHYNVSEQDFFNPLRDQNIQRKKMQQCFT